MTALNKIRWLAVATGCLTVVMTILDGLSLLAVVPILLILGAALAGNSPREGRYLMWIGSAALSAYALPIGIGILLVSLRGGTDLILIVTILVMVLMVLWCDLVLVIDGFKTMRTRNKTKNERSPEN
jgi:hypothetical protein